MWMAIYLFALVVGGVLLGASIFLGGGEAGDGDHGVGHDADLDAGVDGDADVDDHGSHVTHGDSASPSGDAGGALTFFLWSLGSLRFWTFFLAFFGLTGLALEGLGLVAPGALGPSLAIGMGLVVAYGGMGALGALSGDRSTSHVSAGDYVGKSARVLLPVRPGEGSGKVRVRVAGSDVDLLATTDDPRGFAARDEALIIQVDGTRVRIARMDDVGGG